MPIHSEWDDQHQRIILRKHTTVWTWKELHEHNATVVPRMLKAVSHPVSIIADMRQTYWLTGSDFVINVRQNIRDYTHYSIDVIVFVLTDPSIGALLVNSHQQFDRSNRRYHTVQELDDARQYIARHRAQGS